MTSVKLINHSSSTADWNYSLNDQSITALAEKVDEVLSLSIEERTKLGEKAQQFILDTKNATIQCTKILELIKRT